MEVESLGVPQQGKPGHCWPLEAIPPPTATTAAARSSRASAVKLTPAPLSAKARVRGAISPVEPVVARGARTFHPVLSIFALHLRQRQHRSTQQVAQLLAGSFDLGQFGPLLRSQQIRDPRLLVFAPSLQLFRALAARRPRRADLSDLLDLLF